MPRLTPWGTPSSLSGGRILKCFPHPIARSAARTVAGQTLKNEPAEVRGSGTGWREQNSALCSQRIASLVVLDTLRPSVQLPTCLGSLHGERHHLIWGPNFEMLPRLKIPAPRLCSRLQQVATPADVWRMCCETFQARQTNADSVAAKVLCIRRT